MGNKNAKVEKSTVAPEDLQWKFYTKKYEEGSKEMPEDPEFPNELMRQSKEWEYTGPYHAQNGTNVYYPGQKKTKMWVGQYRVLNPADWLCNPNVCGENMHAMCSTLCDNVTGSLNKESKINHIFNTCGDIDESPLPQTCNLFNVFGQNNQNNQHNLQNNNKNIVDPSADCTAYYSPQMSQNVHQDFQNPELHMRMQNAVRVATGQQYGENNLQYSLKTASFYSTPPSPVRSPTLNSLSTCSNSVSVPPTQYRPPPSFSSLKKKK